MERRQHENFIGFDYHPTLVRMPNCTSRYWRFYQYHHICSVHGWNTWTNCHLLRKTIMNLFVFMPFRTAIAESVGCWWHMSTPGAESFPRWSPRTKRAIILIPLKPRVRVVWIISLIILVCCDSKGVSWQPGGSKGSRWYDALPPWQWWPDRQRGLSSAWWQWGLWGWAICWYETMKVFCRLRHEVTCNCYVPS